MGTKRRWAEVSDVFRAKMGWGVDVSKSVAIAYVDFLKKLAMWSLFVVIGLLPLPVIGSIFHISWLNGLYLVVIALLTCTWLTAASPVVMLAQYGYDEIKGVRKLTQLKTGFLFWALLLAIYFYLVPVWNYPAAIPLIFLICGVLALGFVRFGIGINPKLGVGAVVVIFVLITLSFYMPASRSAATAFVGWLDKGVAATLTSPLQPIPKTPKRLPCNDSSIETIAFFDPVTGEPKVWYYAGEDGRVELFDGPGYHPHYKQELKPVVPDVVTQIKKQLEAEAERTAQQQRKRREEARATEVVASKKDANRVKPPPSPIKQQSVVLVPEDAEGQVHRPDPIDLIKGREGFIKPEQSLRDANEPKKR